VPVAGADDLGNDVASGVEGEEAARPDPGGTADGDAGVPEDADDALYVLTAVLLTPARFPAVLGDDFPEACGALGLAPGGQGYGLVLGQDGAGARWTVAVDDVSLVAVAIAAWDCGMAYDLSPAAETVVAVLPGWPLALAVAAPGVPAPHDPPGEEEPLVPADAGAWGPAQRRLGADEIALQWAEWRAKLADGGGEQAAGDGGGEPAAGPQDVVSPPSHPGVVRVLQELEEYAAGGQEVPLGRVRSSFAPGGARALRADGPGWSFVARTDDMAFVLLDSAPGEVMPVGRGASLPVLLEALDGLAVRPT
jgi:hypothetical protein